jgi:hypothetical protein
MHATGEQGKVDESMREMAAIEALKSEKSEKEVNIYLLWDAYIYNRHFTSENFNN